MHRITFAWDTIFLGQFFLRDSILLSVLHDDPKRGKTQLLPNHLVEKPSIENSNDEVALNVTIRIAAVLLIMSTAAFGNDKGNISAKALTGTCYGSTGKRGPDAGSLLTIDLETGEGTVVGATGKEAVPGLAINSTGSIYGTTVDKQGNPSELILIDAADGSAVTLGSTGITTIEGIAFDANDVLFGVANDGDLYIIDITSAQVTLVGDTEVFGAAGLAFDPTDGGLFLSGGGLAEDEIYSIDPVTAAATLIGFTNVDSAATPDIAFDDAGQMFGSKGGGQNENFLISINKATAEGAVVGPIGVLAVSGLAFGPSLAVSVERSPDTVPGNFALDPNYPNPFNPSTTIGFTLPHAGDVRLAIHNVRGQLVHTLVSGLTAEGRHQAVWDGRDRYGHRVASGLYLFRMQAGDFVAVRKMILTK